MSNFAESDSPPDSDAVLVVSVWHSPDRFLGRLTMGDRSGDSAVQTVTSPDELLEHVRAWLTSIT